MPSRSSNATARKQEASLDWLLNALERKQRHCVNGTAVFLTGAAPTALVHNLKHNHILHERNIVLTISTADLPQVANADRIMLERLTESFTAVLLTYGFMETPNVAQGLALCRRRGLNIDPGAPTFFVSRRVLLRITPGVATDVSIADAAVAGEAFQMARPFGGGCCRLFPDPVRPRR